VHGDGEGDANGEVDGQVDGEVGKQEGGGDALGGGGGGGGGDEEGRGDVSAGLAAQLEQFEIIVKEVHHYLQFNDPAINFDIFKKKRARHHALSLFLRRFEYYGRAALAAPQPTTG